LGFTAIGVRSLASIGTGRDGANPAAL